MNWHHLDMNVQRTHRHRFEAQEATVIMQLSGMRDSIMVVGKSNTNNIFQCFTETIQLKYD